MLALVAAPAALALGVAAPGSWALAVLWVLGVALLVLVDGMLASGLRGPITVTAPAAVPVGADVTLRPEMAGAPSLDFAAEVSEPLIRRTGFAYRAARRGTARIERVWARARGPLGLGAWQRSHPADIAVRVTPDIAGVRETAMRQRFNGPQFGQRMRLEAGEGQEFQALTGFQPGMARRTIDWKASARHLSLLAREYRTERDNPIVLAVDAGRVMAEPVGGVPRIDRAVSAALLAAFVALKSGDRARLFAFDSKPRVDSGSVSGPRAFARLHAHAAEIDYGAEETNFTLGLTLLDQRLDRRSLIVLFTEFSDPTAAELMLAAAGRLLRRHRLLFVLFHDEELATFAEARPTNADDVTRANVAHTLLRERRIVVERLKRQGIDVIEAAAGDAPLALVERYLQMRERP
ncbi:DUF58 domain-containing protein [Sphingomonas spermidinifaciens]|uniref:DUF58 domain-containing protein n=2 Tax=Sphingomonas spermidinifaciens TaxID=1141889 RepID=A0A2A4B7U7_9SPHN|nr:DUF58 domain-containing protein [Sphingomonas spermidinifaciens]